MYVLRRAWKFEILENRFGDGSEYKAGVERCVVYILKLDRWQYHISLQSFGKGLEAAARAVFPNASRSRYTKVFALLLCWEDEDPQLPVSFEVNRLFDVFQNVYHFETEVWKIPDQNCHAKLNQKILDFVLTGDDSEEHLKIVYYAGHAKLAKNRLLTWTSWRCNQMAKCPTVKWSGIQNVLEEAQSDALILLDCCAAGAANTLDGNGVTELIAACGYNAIANGVGQYSFTHALILELLALSSRPYFTVAYLYSNIYSRIQGRMPEDGRERHPPPIHLVLTSEQQFPRSIQLSPCLSGSQGEFSRRASIAEGKRPQGRIISSEPVRETEIKESWDRDPSLASQSTLPFTHVPRLAFAVRLKDSLKPAQLRTDLFVEWLRNVPTIAEEVKVEAGFDSFSSLVILSMPVAMFTFLPRDLAIVPLGPITSSNLVRRTRPVAKKTQIIHSREPTDSSNFAESSITVIPHQNSKRSRDGRPGPVYTTHYSTLVPLPVPTKLTAALGQVPEDTKARSSDVRVITPINAPKTPIPSPSRLTTGPTSRMSLNVVDGLRNKSNHRQRSMIPPTPPRSVSPGSSLDSLDEELSEDVESF